MMTPPIKHTEHVLIRFLSGAGSIFPGPTLPTYTEHWRPRPVHYSQNSLLTYHTLQALWPLWARGSVSPAATLLGRSLCPGKGAPEAGEHRPLQLPASLSTGPDSAPLEVLVLLGHDWCVSDKAGADGPVAISQGETLALF